MAQQQLIFEGTAENFSDLVVGNSHRGLVMVNFWARNAGPCLRLYPVLEAVVGRFSGRFILVNVDTQAQPSVAREWSVSSVPNVKLFRQGEVVESLRSYQNEADVARMVEAHLPRASDKHVLQAAQRFNEGEREQAFRMLAELAMADPENLRIPLTLAKFLIVDGQASRAFDLLVAMPEEAREDAAIGAMMAHAQFIGFGEQAAADEGLAEPALLARLQTDASDHEARFRLAALALLRDEYEAALEGLLELVRRDNGFGQFAGRRGMQAVFQILGADHPLVARFQRLMFSVLH